MGKKDGRWAIEVNEVGPKVVQPLKPTVHNVITSNPLNTAKPKSVCLEAAHSQCLKSAFKLRFEIARFEPTSQFRRRPRPTPMVHIRRYATTITEPVVPLSLVSPSVSASPGTDKSISGGSHLVPSNTSSDGEVTADSVLACY